MLIGGLAKCRIVAGEQGVDRQIQYVTVMEVPDAIQWLKGEDLLLTSLYPIKDDPAAQQALVQQLVDRGSSALAIKTHRFVEQIPEVMIAESNRLSFPIIEIEPDVSYLDIMTPLMSVILDKTAPKQSDYEELFQWITELALAGKGLDTLVQALSKMMKNLVTLESIVPYLEGLHAGRQIAPLSASQVNELRKSKRPLRMVRKLDGVSTSCIVSPLMLNEEIHGFITCWETGNGFRKIDFDMLERAIPLFALEFMKVKTRADVELEYRNLFFAEVLTGNIQQEASVIEKAKFYGWDLRLDYQVMVLDADQFAMFGDFCHHDELKILEFKRKLANSVEKAVAKRVPSVIVVFWSDKIVVLLPMRHKDALRAKEEALTVARELQEHLRKQYEKFTFTIGIGRFYQGVQGIHRGYTDALQAIHVGRRTWGGDRIIHFDSLGVYRLLSLIEHHAELDALFAETIGTLEAYDQQHSTNLTETLEQYFACDGSLTETAARLFIHVNTLKYRLRKIEQITGCQLQETEGRFQLYLGAKIKAMLQSRI